MSTFSRPQRRESSRRRGAERPTGKATRSGATDGKGDEERSDRRERRRGAERPTGKATRRGATDGKGDEERSDRRERRQAAGEWRSVRRRPDSATSNT